MIEAIRATRGPTTLCARRLGCDRATVARYCTRYPAVRAALDEARSQQLDLAEAKLFQAIEAGELPAITFYLRTIGRHRGYSERTEVAVDGRLAVSAEAVELRVVLMEALAGFPQARAAAAAALVVAAEVAARRNDSGQNGHRHGR